MPAGRPPKGPKLIDNVEGSEEAKQRAEVILETITGETSVLKACEILGISETRFYQIRDMALKGAVSSLEPGTRGRPLVVEEVSAPEVEALRKRVADLENELKIAQTRTMLATTFPNLVDDAEAKKKMNMRRERRRRRKAERQRRKS
jgi:hypothetical protein